MIRGTWLKVLPLSIGALVAAPQGCTLATNSTSTQCRSQQDCLSRGPDFADTTCTIDRVCQKIQVDQAGCSTNKECVDLIGGAPALCRKSDGHCVTLETNSCKVHAEPADIIDDNIVYMGVTVPTVDIGRLADAATDMARKEIRLNGGLAPTVPGGPRRPLGLVTCSGEQVTPPIAQKDYSHLVNDVQLPWAISTMVTAREIQASNTFLPAGVLSLTSNSLTEVTSLPSNGLLYRTGFSDAQEIQIINPLITDYLVPTMQADGQMAAGEDLRVVVTRDPSEGVVLTSQLAQTLVFNGKPAQDPANSGNFKILDSTDPLDPVDHPNPAAETAANISQIIAFKPHVILQTGAINTTLALYPAFVRAWAAALPGVPQPYWMILIPSTSTSMQGILAGLKNDDARKHLLGLRMFPLDFDPMQLGLFAQAFAIANPDLNATLSLPAWAFYDSVYMLAYSAIAIGNAPFTGEQLSRGLLKVAGTGGGIQINWGPTDYKKAVAALTAGNQISYKGIIGSYGFSNTGPDHPGFVDLYCIPSAGGVPAPPLSTGYSFNPATGMAKGTVSCPSN